MSLKAFHLLFISLSIVLAVVFGMWATASYASGGSLWHVAGAALGFSSAAALGFYEAAFLRKCRRLNIS